MPGERITIASLAKRYGVSHLPVRQALRVIEGHRLVRIIPRRGALVTVMHCELAKRDLLQQMGTLGR